MKSSTLPLTSPCSGTKRKTTVPLFFASTGGLRLLSFMPILLRSLHQIDFYSPSLRQSSITTCGLGLLSFMPYCFGRFTSLISTVLPFAGFRKYRAQTVPHSGLYYRKFFLILFLQIPFQASLLVGFTYLHKVPYQAERDLSFWVIQINIR